jgi:hypothetical protein
VLVIGGGIWFVKKTLSDHGIEVGKDGVSVDMNGTTVNVSGNGVSAGTEGTSVKDSLMNMLSGSAAMKCNVSDEHGSYTVLAKSGKVKIDGIDYAAPQPGSKSGDTNKKGTMITTSEMFYMWSGKEGMKWNIKEMEALSKKAGGESAPIQEPADTNWTDWAKSMEASGAKYDCSPAVVTDADFTPPTDVQFQDFGEMMKQFSNMGAQVQGQGGVPSLPAGVPQMPTGTFPQ